MDTSEHPQERIRRRHPIRNGALILVVLAIAALLAGYLVARRNLASALTRARELGPTTFAELEAARRTWPADQDAGPVFARIAQEMNEQEKGMTSEEREALKGVPFFREAELPPLGHLWNDQDRAAAEDHLAHMGKLLGELDGLRRFRGGKLPLHVAEDPMMTLIPELAPIRQAAKLELLAALRAGMDGPVTDLRERVEVLSRLRQLIEDQPTLISSLVAVALDALLCDALERALAVDAIRAEDLQPLREVLADRKAYAVLKWGLLGERATFIEIGEQLRTGRMADSPAYARVPVLNLFFCLDVARGVGHHNELIAAADDPQMLVEVSRAVGQKVEDAPVWAVFTKVLAPGFTGAVENAMQSEALLRATRLGLAIERYRLDRGAFPARLDELVPASAKEVPGDPFGGQPLRYQRTPEGVVVYSVGVNQTDDGGRPAPRQHRNAGDLVFRVLAPEHRRKPPVAASEPGEE